MARPAALDRISIAAIGMHGGRARPTRRSAPRRPGSTASGRRSCFAASFTQATWLAAQTERIGRRDRDRMGVHPQPVHPRAVGARRRRAVGRALPARPRRRRQAPQRDLARGRVRPSGSAPARDDRGGAADHGAGPQGRADPLRGRVPRHRHQGLDPAAPARARVGADLRRRGARGDGADGGRRRRRPDRPSDVLAALARRGPDRQLRARARALGPRPRRPRLHPDRLHARSTTTRRPPTTRRGGRSPSTRPCAPTCRCGRCTASATPPPRSATPSAPATSPRCPATSPTRWSTPTAPPARSTRSAPASSEVAERADGVFLTPRDLLHRARARSPRYQARIVEAFGPAARLVGGQLLDEALELREVAQRRPVTDADQRRAAGRAACGSSAGSRPGRG